MREIIKKSKFKIKNLPHGIVIEKEIIDEKTSAKTIQSFFFEILDQN